MNTELSAYFKLYERFVHQYCSEFAMKCIWCGFLFWIFIKFDFAAGDNSVTNFDLGKLRTTNDKGLMKFITVFKERIPEDQIEINGVIKHQTTFDKKKRLLFIIHALRELLGRYDFLQEYGVLF